MTSKEQDALPESETSVPLEGPGALLRAAREKAGLSIEEVAGKLFLRVRNIEEVEQDILDEKRPVTFIRGYVRTYAKLMGLDEAHLLKMFDEFHTSPTPPAKLQSFSKRVIHQTNDARWMMVTYIILTILVAAFLLWWWQQPQAPLTTSSPVPVVERENAPELVLDAPDVSSADNIMSGDVISEDVIPEDIMPEDVMSENVMPEDVSSSAEPADDTLSPAQALEADATSSETAVAVFTFGTDCWVNITDATGEAIAYGVKTAGRVMTISGVPPLEVTLGMPNNVSIMFDGEAVDMSRFQNGRTARFSLPLQDL